MTPRSLQERAKENFAQRPATGESASDKAAKQPHKDMEKKLIALSGVGVVIVATKSGTFEARASCASVAPPGHRPLSRFHPFSIARTILCASAPQP